MLFLLDASVAGTRSSVRLATVAEAFVYVAMTRLMVRKLAHL